MPVPSIGRRKSGAGTYPKAQELVFQMILATKATRLQIVTRLSLLYIPVVIRINI